MINICQQYDDLWSVGPSLRIDDIPDSYPMKEVNIKNQIKQKFWDSKKKKNISIKDHNYTIYKPSVIDGTLSIFPVTFLPMFHEYFCNFRAIRVAGQYQIRHLDWYISEADEELLNYIQTVGTGSTHSTNWVLGINDLNPSNELFLDEAKKLVHSLNLS
jgi:hypothetical protein